MCSGNAAALYRHPLPETSGLRRKGELSHGIHADADKLIPDLSPREELVILARCLWREGYSDHLAGHIT